MDIHKETGIGINIMYRWRVDAVNKKGLSATTKYKNADKWSSQDKFTVVLKTTNLSEVEFSEYCREKGIYLERIREWQDAYINANSNAVEHSNKLSKELNAERKQKVKLGKELPRKDKALAEVAALLIIRKKPMRFGETEEEKE